MNLHQNQRLFQDAVRFTAQQRGIKEIYVEKDYWVCLALHTIFSGETKEYAVFKGGTALSKCFEIIERFSEDIDLVVLNQGDSGNQLKTKLGKLSKSIQPLLPEVEMEGITSKLGMIRKTAHSYPKLFEGKFGQIRDFIVLESTWLGYHEPHVDKSISSYIYQMMEANSQNAIALEYDLLPFNVRVLAPSRTICEKIMSLVRFSHSNKPIENLRLKVRHLYDLHQLLSLKEYADFLASADFETMLIKVGNDDAEGYRSGNEWLMHHPREALLFQNPEVVWKELNPTYNKQFKDLVFGHLPPANDILNTIQRIAQRLATIKWSVAISNTQT